MTIITKNEREYNLRKLEDKLLIELENSTTPEEAIHISSRIEEIENELERLADE